MTTPILEAELQEAYLDWKRETGSRMPIDEFVAEVMDREHD